MIICKTPLRISFFGGGTDYKEYFLEYGFDVLSTTIDKYSYILINDLENSIYDYKFKCSYSSIETTNSIDKIKHNVIRECLNSFLMEYSNLYGIDLTYVSDIPAKTGLGSSSNFTVGLIHALKFLNRQKINKQELGLLAYKMEHDILKENVGMQDSLACAKGGFNHIFRGGGEISDIYSTSLNSFLLPDKLMLFYTGIKRDANDIAKKQISNIKNNINILHEMRGMVLEAKKIINDDNDLTINEFGKLLDENWKLKKMLASNISNNYINDMYELAKKNGCIGGKLLGAGGGGFLLLYVPEERQKRIQEVLPLKRILFNFENEGSTVLKI